MSLKIWLPLNGDYQNRGLSNVEINGNPSVTYVDGKIGKCLNTSSIVEMSVPEGISSTNYSLGMWVKSKPTNTTNSVWWRITRVTFTDGTVNTLYLASEGRYKVEYTPEYNTYCDTQQWHYLIYVFEGTKLYSYVDGELIGSANVTNAERTISSFSVGGNNNVYLNDVRLYDHCLSIKEIKEISKGLCLHYLLDNNGCGQENLVKGNYSVIATATSKTSIGSATITLPTGYTSWNQLIGKTVTLSYDYSIEGDKLNNTGNYSKDRFGIHGTVTGADSSGSVITHYPFASYLEASGRGKAVQTFTFPTNMTEVTNFTLALQAYNQPATNNSNTWYIKNVKLELGDKATAFILHKEDVGYNAMKFDQEFDASGFNNNGAKVGGILTSIADTSRYSTCYELTRINSANDQSNCAMIVNNNFYFPSEFTISYWAYDYGVTGLHPNNLCSYFGYGTSAGYSSNGIHNYDSKIALNTCTFGSTTKARTISVSMSYPKNTWVHIAITFDGINLKLYNNGVLKETSTTGLTVKEDILRSDSALYVGADQAGGLWRGVSGRMSDFRIYATALSDIDIKELYNIPVAIDNDGNLYSMQLHTIEAPNFKIKKTGVIQSEKFVEDSKQMQIEKNVVIAKQFYEY